MRIPNSIRFVVWLSQIISSTLATKLALYLFFRPKRFKTPNREHQMRDATEQ